MTSRSSTGLARDAKTETRLIFDATLALPQRKVKNVAYEEVQTRSGVVQGGIERGRRIRGRPQGGRVRGDRFGKQQGAVRLSFTRARQGHFADAGGPGRREDHSPSARGLVCASIACGTSAAGLAWVVRSKECSIEMTQDPLERESSPVDGIVFVIRAR